MEHSYFLFFVLLLSLSPSLSLCVCVCTHMCMCAYTCVHVYEVRMPICFYVHPFLRDLVGSLSELDTDFARLGGQLAPVVLLPLPPPC